MFFKVLFNKIKRWNRVAAMNQTAPSNPQESCPAFPKLSGSLAKDLASIKEIIGDSADIKTNQFAFGEEGNIKSALVYVDGLVDQQLIATSVLNPLMQYKGNEVRLSEIPIDIVEIIKTTIISTGDIEEEDNPIKLITAFLSGETVLLINGFKKGLIISARKWDKRSVSEPQTEAVVRGPREGFTENFRTNTSLVRRRLKTPQLRMEHMIVGRKTLTSVCLAYIEGVVDESLVKKVKKRLNSINVDSIIDSGYIEEYIEDNPFSIFSTVNYTEKPDVAVARILEGRIAIIVDGSPFVLTVPMLFIESFQTAEDYYIRTFYSSITRILRYIAFFISVFAPAGYIALTTFHQELIPTTLLFTIAGAREGTPFSALLEALIMLFSFEILREAGLRLPRPVGQAISIVGALVMGEAAVSAGLVGAPMVITIAITAVSGFVVPSQNDSASIIRVIAMVVAAALGGYGIALVFLGILIHLGSMESFGVPYFEGIIPVRNMQDTFIRMPLWSMVRRPDGLAPENSKRKSYFIPPAGSGRKEVEKT